MRCILAGLALALLLCAACTTLELEFTDIEGCEIFEEADLDIESNPEIAAALSQYINWDENTTGAEAVADVEEYLTHVFELYDLDVDGFHRCISLYATTLIIATSQLPQEVSLFEQEE